MTIELQTGLPGACKTQYTLWRVESEYRRSVKDGKERPIFYSGIPINKEALPHWQEIKADEWYTAPPESIVILDEAQRLFRPRANGSAVPRYESELETHRHGGIDLILITQSPRLVSVGVRELVGKHYHAVRKWGSNWTTIHWWPECRLNVQSRKDSTQIQFKQKPEVYKWYKSAEAHTIKRHIPFRVWLFLSLPIILGVLVFTIYSRLSSKTETSPVSAPNSAAPASTVISGKLTRAGYLEAHEPRVKGLAYTAQAYDEVTRPTQAPYPAACMYTSKRCQCYTQQATRLDVTPELCKSIADGGFFVAWDTSGNRVDRSEQGGAVKVATGHTSPQTASLP